ncbi:MAG: proline dehydrogenase family protein, partial [Bacteroidales bacterium]|nr:proline dehydrogenase family protein [Bacteroidales bacterium]
MGRVPDSLREAYPGRYYEGGPDYLLLKCQYRCGDMFHAGVTLEKDVGESFFRASNRQGFDFSSFHLMYRGDGVLRQAFIGDYQVQFGQGLAMGMGFQMQPSGPDGVKRAKFINLDMEEYKDAHLTMKLFKDVLSLPQFKNYEAGIVVQAYLPDAWDFQTELLEFAKKRVAEGGSPIKMRIVKGCNLDMENIVSDLRGWPNPVRPNKTEVDANYLHIIERGLKPENAKVLHIGMASHNLFTISYAYLLTEKYQTPKDCFCFEMLEGMANHVWRAQKKFGNHVILYTPVVKKEHFLNAISYLVRRMDENTAPDNFLTHSFSLKPDTKEWEELEKQFVEAYNMKDTITHIPTRTQDRNKPYEGQKPQDEMINEPDTDFDRFCNQEWLEKIFKKWKAL